MNMPKHRAAPFTPIVFIRLGALVRGLPAITNEAQKETDRFGGDFHANFTNVFQKYKQNVLFRKGVGAVLHRFDELKIKTHIVTSLPSEKFVAPVLDRMKSIAPHSGVAKIFTPSDFIFSGDQQAIHQGYGQIIHRIRIAQSNHERDSNRAPIIAMVFGYEQPDALLSVEANKMVLNNRTPSLVLPFIHARAYYKAPESTPPIHLDQRMTPINPKELIIRSQCLKADKLSPYNTAERYFESRDLKVLAGAALQIAGTLGRMKSLNSFPCN